MKKGRIWHMSLTSVYTECPYCHAINADDWHKSICKACNNVLDFSLDTERKTKDYMEVESLGLHGPVYKDEKGKWQEWKDPYKKEVVYGN